MNVVDYQEIERLYPHADDAMTARIHRAVDMVNQAARPREVQASFKVDETLSMRGFVPAGKDIKKHLSGSEIVIVGACTLGADVDRLIERTKIIDLATAYLVDQAASYAVENLAEKTCRDTKAAMAADGYRCTTRYSCGYGDFDLGCQADLLRLAGADKALGIQVNEGGMMYPTKTITYLVGVSQNQ